MHLYHYSFSMVSKRVLFLNRMKLSQIQHYCNYKLTWTIRKYLAKLWSSSSLLQHSENVLHNSLLPSQMNTLNKWSQRWLNHIILQHPLIVSFIIDTLYFKMDLWVNRNFQILWFKKEILEKCYLKCCLKNTLERLQRRKEKNITPKHL